jgi:hypothetical protein
MNPFPYRHAAAAAALVLLSLTFAGCGGADAPSAPPGPVMGAVQFKIDALSCVGAAAIDFYLDGSVVGTETLAAGGSSRQYETTAGAHVLGAAVSNTHSYVWPSSSVTVPANTALLWLLRCA